MNDDIKHPVAKGLSAGVVFLGGMTWGEVASMLAALYTLCLLIEWLWKRILKPAAQRRGWIAGRAQFLDSAPDFPDLPKE